jgi:hypothetical protein
LPCPVLPPRARSTVDSRQQTADSFNTIHSLVHHHELAVADTIHDTHHFARAPDALPNSPLQPCSSPARARSPIACQPPGSPEKLSLHFYALPETAPWPPTTTSRTPSPSTTGRTPSTPPARPSARHRETTQSPRISWTLCNNVPQVVLGAGPPAAPFLLQTRGGRAWSPWRQGQAWTWRYQETEGEEEVVVMVEELPVEEGREDQEAQEDAGHQGITTASRTTKTTPRLAWDPRPSPCRKSPFAAECV